MDILINADQALELLKGVVEKRGREFTYHSPQGGYCRYELHGEPSCGVGQALYDAGIPIEALQVLDTASGQNDPVSIRGIKVNHVLAPFGVRISVEARHIFGKFQFAQDKNVAWGPALDDAVMLAERIRKESE